MRGDGGCKTTGEEGVSSSEGRASRGARMDCPLGRCVSTGDGILHLCVFGRVKGHSLLIIKTPLVYEKLGKKGAARVYET